MATQVNDSNFDAVVLQSQLPVLVDFWAPWCGPCRAIGPIIDEIANEYEGKLSVVKLNVDENPGTPGKYGIRAIPTLILFKNGEVVEQVTGAVSKSSIATMIEQKALVRKHYDAIVVGGRPQTIAALYLCRSGFPWPRSRCLLRRADPPRRKALRTIPDSRKGSRDGK